MSDKITSIAELRRAMKFSKHTGTSIEDAIVISNVADHQEMVEAEYEYIKKKFRWSFPIKQELIPVPPPSDNVQPARFYDRITIRQLPLFKKRQIYFDITEGFAFLKAKLTGGGR